MEAEIKVIETEAEYERAFADFSRLLAVPDDSPERETRDLLALRLKD